MEYANTSPEPVSGTARSLGEDGMVAAMVALVLAYPVVAGVVALVPPVLCIVVSGLVFQMAERTRALWRERRARRPGDPVRSGTLR